MRTLSTATLVAAVCALASGCVTPIDYNQEETVLSADQHTKAIERAKQYAVSEGLSPTVSTSCSYYELIEDRGIQRTRCSFADGSEGAYKYALCDVSLTDSEEEDYIACKSLTILGGE